MDKIKFQGSGLTFLDSFMDLKKYRIITIRSHNILHFLAKTTFLSFHHPRLRFTLLGTPFEFLLFLLLVQALLTRSHLLFFLCNALIFFPFFHFPPLFSFFFLGSKYP